MGETAGRCHRGQDSQKKYTGNMFRRVGLILESGYSKLLKDRFGAILL
jgi:hypothetical protein